MILFNAICRVEHCCFAIFVLKNSVTVHKGAFFKYFLRGGVEGGVDLNTIYYHARINKTMFQYAHVGAT